MVEGQVNIGGGRFLISRRAWKYFSWTLSDAFFKQSPFGHWSEHELLIHDPYAGIQTWWQERSSHLFLYAGYRYEDDQIHHAAYKITVSFDWDFLQIFPHRVSIEFQGRALIRQQLAERDWTEGNTFVALKWSPHLVASIGLEWNTRAVAVDNRSASPGEFAL